MEKETCEKNVKKISENPSLDQDFLEKILDQISKYETFDDILHAIHKLSLAFFAWLKYKVL